MAFPPNCYPDLEGQPGIVLPADRLVFMHMEKAAGTTIFDMISPCFPPEEICPERSPAIQYWAKEDLSHYRLFAAHASVRELRNVPRPYKIFTFLRDPVQRLISAYEYWSSHTWKTIGERRLHLEARMKRLPFRDAVSPQTLGVFGQLWNPYTQKIGGDLHFAPSGRVWRDEDELYEKALENLEKFNTVGIVEDMASSVAAIQRQLGISIQSYSGQRSNKTADNKFVDPNAFEDPNDVGFSAEIMEAALNVTYLDRKLYDVVVNRLADNNANRRSFVGMCGDGGRPITCNGSAWVSAAGPGRCLLFGPYVRLLPGRHRVAFKVMLDPRLLRRESRWVARTEIASNLGRTLISQREVHARDIDPSGTGDVYHDFELTGFERDVEFKFYVGDDRHMAVCATVDLNSLI